MSTTLLYVTSVTLADLQKVRDLQSEQKVHAHLSPVRYGLEGIHYRYAVLGLQLEQNAPHTTHTSFHDMLPHTNL